MSNYAQAISRRSPISGSSATAAAMRFNFPPFIQWPEAAFKNDQDVLVIGEVELDSFSNSLEKDIAKEKCKAAKSFCCD